MQVEILVTNTECKVLTPVNKDMLTVLQQICQFKVEGAEFKAYAYRRRFNWDGYKKLFNVQTRRFPIGLLDKVSDTLRGYGVDVVYKFDRKIDDSIYNYEFDQSFIRPYQHNAIMTSIMHGNGIVKVATGGGKTVIAGVTIGAVKKKSIFIVHTKDLLYQAIESFGNIFKEEKIGQIGDGVYDPQNITVATMQTLAILGKINDIEKKDKYDEDSDVEETMISEQELKQIKFHEYAKTVQCVMMDEVQIVSSKTAYAVRFLFEYANIAFGYSASPWRDDGSDLMIEGAFGKRIIDIDASTLIKQGYLVRPTIEVHQTYYDTRGQSENGKQLNYAQLYKKFIVENADRNEQVALDAIHAYQSGMNTLVLVTQLKQGSFIADIMTNKYGMDVAFISGKTRTKIRRQTIQDMRDGKIQIMIASTIADVGLDIPRLQCIVEAGAGKSSVTALQRLGRIMRPFENKETCLFITYRDRIRYLSEHIKKKLEIWNTEKEFIIKEDNV